MDQLDALDKAVGHDLSSLVTPTAQSIGRLLVVLFLAYFVLKAVRRSSLGFRNFSPIQKIWPPPSAVFRIRMETVTSGVVAANSGDSRIGSTPVEVSFQVSFDCSV